MRRELQRVFVASVLVLVFGCSGGTGDEEPSGVDVVEDQAAELPPVDVALPDLADAAPELVDTTSEVSDAADDVPQEVFDGGGEVADTADLAQEDVAPLCEEDGDCTDDDYCTVDKCVSGECLHQEKNCNDSNMCTEDWCDPESGLCQNEVLDCDDDNPCTLDSCLPGTGCEHQEIPDCCPGTLVFEDGFEGELSWTVVQEFGPAETSVTWQPAGKRVHSGEQSLYFGSLETESYEVGERLRVFVETAPIQLPDEVDSQVGFWAWANVEASANYDNFTFFVLGDEAMVPVWGKELMYQMKNWKEVVVDLKAFRGQQVKFRFVFETIDGHDNDYEGFYIDDFRLYDMCPDEGCITKVECADGLLCTSGECVAGECVYEITESCCMHLGDCLDTDPCTLDACTNNVCEPLVLSPPYCCYQEEDCNDENVCTLDICDESGICLHPPSQEPGCCEVNGDCDDGNPCTDNICNNDDSSCYFPFNTIACDDGDMCTKSDHCMEGSCGGDPVTCDDGNACTYNECAPQSGCYYPNIPQGAECDDLNPCTEGDVCLLGDCGGEWIEGCCLQDVDCNDDDDCTIDKCTDNECQNINTCCFSDEECDDFDDICTDDACIDGECVYTPTGVEGCCQQVLFRDTFEEDLGWQFDGEWERGMATASSGQSYGSPDPATDHTSSEDDYIIGVNIGGNAEKVLHEFHWATSPVISIQGGANVHLTFWRWLNSDYANYMVNAVQVYNGSSWVSLWQSGGSPGIQDGSWSFHDFDVTAHINAGFRVRFGFQIGSTGVFTVGSWNVDDVTVADMPADGPGLCCDYLSDCQGIYPVAQCTAGMCEVP